MAGSLNKVILIGRLGQDPEVREVGTSKVANFSIATDESYTDRTGNKVEKTEWHRIVMWNKAAENAEAYLKKGSLVYIEGKLETRSWDNDRGEKRYSTEIKSFSFQMLDNKSDQSQRNDAYSSQSNTQTEPEIKNSFSKEDVSSKSPNSIAPKDSSIESTLDNTIIGNATQEDKEDDLPF
jgi:single-strand DNA-binding protein